MNTGKNIFLFVTLCLLIVLSVNSYGQLNIKVGYNGGYTEGKVINDVIQRFNQDRDYLEGKMNDIHLFSGLELGLRYRIGNAAFEISYTNLSANSDAFGQEPGTNSNFEEKLKISSRNFSLGVQSMFGNFGIGTSIADRKIKFRTNIQGFDEDRDISSTSGLASRLFLMYQIPSNTVALTIQPFVEIPWETSNFYGLEKEYFPDTTRPQGDFDSDLMLFGVSFVFYNGPQK